MVMVEYSALILKFFTQARLEKVEEEEEEEEEPEEEILTTQQSYMLL